MSVTIGILSGLILGGFLYVFQQWTAIPVYTLLMNVDYFPVLKDVYLPSWLEFSLHLLVSIMIVSLLFFVLEKWNLSGWVWVYLLVNIGIGLIIFPTTMLSDRTPEIDQTGAWILWIVGHAIYGFSVWVMYMFVKRLKETSS